jgi:glycosyltransferase involved in cell wall biosynthesis
MRILSVIHELGPGGMERVCQNNTVSFADRGHDVAVFAHWRGGYRAEALAARGIPVFIGGADQAGFDAGLRQAIAFSPDLLWVHGVGVADSKLARIIRAVRAASTRRVPVVTTSHFARPDHSADQALYDVHVQISEWGMWRWRQWTRLQRPRPLGVVVPHFVAAAAFTPSSVAEREATRRQYGIPGEAILFGRLGQPDPSIWPRGLLASFAQFAAEESRAWLLLVGSPPSVAAQRKRLPPDVASRVVLAPFIFGDEQLRRCYGTLDAFLHVTRIGDTFGLVLCESMLCGVPVVTVATPAKSNGHVEIVGHEIGGLVCANPGEVVPAMRALAYDELLRKRLAAQGREHVLRVTCRERVTDLNLAVADAALRAHDRTELESLLRSVPGLATEVTQERIIELNRRVLGSYPLAERVNAWIVGQPRIFAAWLWLKRASR